MELFAVNRYQETTVNNDPSKENTILNKLLKKAEKRKRRSEKKEKTPDKSLRLNVEVVEDTEVESESRKTCVESGDGKDAEADIKGEAPHAEFQVLGTDVFEKKKEVQMVLPPWLAYPTIVSNQLSSETQPDEIVENLDYISTHLKKNLKFMKIENLFPVQKAVIPWVLNAHAMPAPFRPRDICVSAPTGSGKTLAFAVPIVQLLSKRVERKIRALVILPVTELAMQVYKVFNQLVQSTNLSVCLFSQSTSFAREQNLLIDHYKGKYYSKADIVVTTPGRLVEHLHATKGFCLKSLQFLVVDEVDRIMTQVHHNWLYHLDAHVKATSDMFMTGRPAPLCLIDLENEAHKQPHKMLFSATLSQDPEKLGDLRLFQPKLFTSIVKSPEELRNQLAESFMKIEQESDRRGEFIGKYTTPAELTEYVCLTEMRYKPLTLYALIIKNGWKKFLCFTNSTEAASRLAFVLQKFLQETGTVESLSSAREPNVRKTLLSQFAKGKLNGLVCSDALSRGIDIKNVEVVISYDAPRHIKTYIHRVGRTARAGRPGIAITLLAPHELPNFNKILSEGGKDENLPEMKADTEFEESKAKIYSTILNELQFHVELDKNIKSVRKKYEKERAIMPKSNEVGVMNRLQYEVSQTVDNKSTTFEQNSRKERRLRSVRKQKQKLKKKMSLSSADQAGNKVEEK